VRALVKVFSVDQVLDGIESFRLNQYGTEGSDLRLIVVGRNSIW
jgi:hypothetical protein